jgi:hypothetical protein
VIAVADRLDEQTLSWQIEREETVLRSIQETLASVSRPRS